LDGPSSLAEALIGHGVVVLLMLVVLVLAMAISGAWCWLARILMALLLTSGWGRLEVYL
jgi:hypothetical protein